jgi:hypothetical protein
MAIDGITRENLLQRCLKPLRSAKPWQPEILLVRGDAGPIVVKDYKTRPFLYRFFVGLPSTWNEARMYRKLAGLGGIPRFYGKLDRYALAMEYIEGRNASTYKTGQLPHDFFHSLKRIIDSVHERNIVLCDLRNRKNILISNNGEPYLIDFCTAFERGRRWSFLRNGLHRIFTQDDYLGLAKLKRHLAPELLTAEEADRLDRGLFLQHEAVAVRNFCVRWLKQLVSK